LQLFNKDLNYIIWNDSGKNIQNIKVELFYVIKPKKYKKNKNKRLIKSTPLNEENFVFQIITFLSQKKRIGQNYKIKMKFK